MSINRKAQQSNKSLQPLHNTSSSISIPLRNNNKETQEKQGHQESMTSHEQSLADIQEAKLPLDPDLRKGRRMGRPKGSKNKPRFKYKYIQDGIESGRPTYVPRIQQKNICTRLKAVVNKHENLCACSIEDIIMLLNENLIVKYGKYTAEYRRLRIDFIEFNAYLHKEFSKVDAKNKFVFEEMIHIIIKGFYNEKVNLIKKLKSANAGKWQCYAWLLERKYSDEFNLKKYSESKVIKSDEEEDGYTDEQKTKILEQLERDERKHAKRLNNTVEFNNHVAND